MVKSVYQKRLSPQEDHSRSPPPFSLWRHLRGTLAGLSIGLAIGLQWGTGRSILAGLGVDLNDGLAVATDDPLLRSSTTTSRKLEGQHHYVPCQLKPYSGSLPITTNITATENAQRFRLSPMDTWTCRQEVPESYPYFLVFLGFQVLECPPKYRASAFELLAATERSRLLGHVGDKWKLKDGCAYYNASVAVMDPSVQTNNNNNNPVTLELFFTTNYRHHSHHMEEIEVSHNIKENRLPQAEFDKLLSPGRREFLAFHLDPIPGTPLQFTIETQHQVPLDSQEKLPDCADVPMVDWVPAGTFKGPIGDPYRAEDPNIGFGNKIGDRWPFRTARCRFPYHSLDHWNEVLAGVRIRELGDSHGNLIRTQAWDLYCPGDGNQHDVGKIRTEYFYDCPSRPNSFQYVWRYYLGMFQSGQVIDGDFGVTTALRSGDLSACRHALGLGLYNVTVLLVTHWSFAYDTAEGMETHLMGLENMFLNCEEAFPGLMETQVFLLQSSTARDSDPTADTEITWRGVQNNLMEQYSQKIQNDYPVLRKYIDFIPMFDMSVARLRQEKAMDPAHMQHHSYRDMVYIQWAAARSALRFRRGVETPIMKADDPNARWWKEVDMDTV